MTLLDAQQYDEKKERRRRIKVISVVVLVLFVASLIYWNRFYPEKRVAGKFFAALQKKDYDTAYRIYGSDPKKYPYNEFYQDWGPGGTWGLIKTYDVYGAAECPHGGSGIVVDVVVNDRAEHAQLWVEKADKKLSTPPCDLRFQ